MIYQRVKSNSESKMDDFEFRDDPTHNQMEYDSKEHLERTSIKLNNEKIIINETITDIKNKYGSKYHRNRISEDKELRIDIEDTNLDSNHKKYFKMTLYQSNYLNHLAVVKDNFPVRPGEAQTIYRKIDTGFTIDQKLIFCQMQT